METGEEDSRLKVKYLGVKLTMGTVVVNVVSWMGFRITIETNSGHVYEAVPRLC